MFIEDKNLDVNSKKIKFSFENKEYEAYSGETVASALIRNGVKNLRKDRSENYRGVYCNMGICNECIVEINGNQSIKSCTANIQENDKIFIQKYNAELPNLKKNIQLEKKILNYDILIIGAGPGGIGASLSLNGSENKIALIDEKQNEISERIDLKDQTKKVLLAIKSMGDKCQEILMLASEGMSMQEMQEITGVKSLGTVLSRLSNCRKELKGLIA